MAARIAVLLVLFFAAPRCLTMKNSKAIEQYQSPINEFDTSLTGGKNYRIVPGKLTMLEGKPVMQFETMLVGKGRVLNVESLPSRLRFYETDAAAQSGNTVYVIQQNACCMDDAAFRRILFLKPGEEITATQILQTYYHTRVPSPGFPDSLLVMDFTNIYTFSAMNAYWKENNNLTYFVQVPGSNYGEVMHEIRWRKRSGAGLAAMYAWYAVTVPVDIVTSPFQLIGLYLYGKGMVK